MRHVSRSLALVCLLAFGSCFPAEEDTFAARTVADHQLGPLPWTSWPDALQAACDPTPVTGRLARAPYLQRVGPDALSIRWIGDAADARVILEPTAEEGEPREARAEPVAGEPMRARVTGLQPSTVYCYRIVEQGETVAGPFAVETAPDTPDAPVDLIALGDSGTAGEGQRAVLNQMRTVPSDLIVHTGDVAYDHGSAEDFQETVFEIYEPLLRSVSFYPTLGNHDLETDDGEPYLRAFELPQGEGDERYYAFDWGPIHFATIDSNHDLEPQIEWLEADLARTELPWIVLYTHHPPWSSGKHGSDEGLRDALAPLLRRYGVALVLSGHDHHYERSRTMEGTTFVVTGGGGRRITFVDPNDHAERAEEVFHFLYARFEGDAARVYAIDASGNVFDGFTVTTDR